MMDIFDIPYYRFNKYFMGAIGQWPYQSPNQRRIQWFCVYCTILSVTLVQGLKLIQIWGDLDIMVEAMVPMGVQVVALMKSSNCISNSVKMKKLLDFIKNDWDILTDKDEIEVLMKYIQRGYYLGILYAACVFSSMTIYLLIPLLPQMLDVIQPLNESRPREFLYQTEYFIDEDEHYASIMFHNYVGTILYIVVIVSADSMLLAYVHHVCGMFTIIANRLENAIKGGNLGDVNVNCEPENDEVYKHIANCLKDHGRAIEFADLLESAYSMSFLFQIGTSMLLMSATGFQVITKLEKFQEAFRQAQFIIGQLVHLFVNSMPSQMLVDHTERLRDSVYFSEWYRFPLRARHLIRLAMLRTLKPCKITAGKLYDMSVENFAKVVQTSMSYFTVLVSVR